jgi:antitoxin (DNA-binding transcriptional repressor) of toxin-antitoxin stability system
MTPGDFARGSIRIRFSFKNIIKSHNHILQEDAMGQTITATNAVRNFSELLNGIRYRGECYTILKGGKPAAIIGPAAASVQDRKLSDLKDILRSLPRLEDDGDAFARDIEQAVALQPPVGEGKPWA